MSKLLCSRKICEGAGIIRQLADSRAGVGKYLHFLRILAAKNLVTCDHINYECEAYKAEEFQELIDETGLNVDEAHELWQRL